VALLAAPAWAQQHPAFPLEALRIRGNAEIATERIVAALGLKVGEAVTRADFTAARDRLLATGAFESVGFEFKPSAANTGYEATYTVEETRPLYRYRFEELPTPDAELRQVLRAQEPVFGDAIPPTPQVMNRYASALARHLGGLEVIGEVNSDTFDELMIVFRPAGPRRNIAEVNFVGNRLLPAETLRRRIQEVTVGRPFSEPLFRQILEAAVRPAYEDQGHVRVEFAGIRTEKHPSLDGLVVTVTVEEGVPYRLGEVRYRGVPEQETSALHQLAAWPAGETFNASAVSAAVARIRRSYAQNGYLQAAARVERSYDDATRLVELTVVIEAGPQYTMGKLEIRGLDILTEPHIRKLWRLQPGDVYRESYPDEFLAMIQAEGYFDNLARTGAQADPRPDHTVDVTLTFVGAKAAANPDRRQRR
jgi:outer membrane protein insertion porin family